MKIVRRLAQRSICSLRERHRHSRLTNTFDSSPSVQQSEDRLFSEHWSCPICMPLGRTQNNDRVEAAHEVRAPPHHHLNVYIHSFFLFVAFFFVCRTVSFDIVLYLANPLSNNKENKCIAITCTWTNRCRVCVCARVCSNKRTRVKRARRALCARARAGKLC